MIALFISSGLSLLLMNTGGFGAAGAGMLAIFLTVPLTVILVLFAIGSALMDRIHFSDKKI